MRLETLMPNQYVTVYLLEAAQVLVLLSKADTQHVIVPITPPYIT